mgnify:CR=1 FL=1|tara:strand:- start:20284 stop:22254 length:1971 start_codon:yes stop_codon:yes gene_type:complete
MNFFESQDRVRKNTFQLVVLFSLAVVSLIVMVNLLVMVSFGFIGSEQVQGGETLQQLDWQTFAAVSAGVVVVVLAGSLYKIMALSAGGKVVAEGLGGQLIPRNTTDPNQRKLLNVVEEMAIASGTPAPPVYLLTDEPGINAFAAGFSPRDAVIGVTQGAIDQLSRDQLQGVIAHEFSHIFNGDMRLNIRLIGVLNGILVLGIIGYYLLYSASFSRRGRSNDKGAAGILALAIGLMVIGFAGTFFGGLIKAAVSRQREYLADASAVQFTRNPDGIAGALKRIGGLEFGSIVENPGAPEISHAFFAQGVSGFVQSLSATHPPLPKRILRIDPHWDGKFDVSDNTTPVQDEEPAKKESKMSGGISQKNIPAILSGAAMIDVANTIDQIGNPKLETINYAGSLIEKMPEIIKDEAREPHGARALIYSLLLDLGSEVRDKQIKYLQVHADRDVFALTSQLLLEMNQLEISFRLPLIDIAIPTLKQLSHDQYQVFRNNMDALINMDSRVDLMEWTLQKILIKHLDAHFSTPSQTQTGHSQILELKQEVELILSVMVYAGQQNQSDIEEAFGAAVKILEIGDLQLMKHNEIGFPDLDHALGELEKLRPQAKQKLLKSCAASVLSDHKIMSVEVELLRAFSDVLGCPIPPIISKFAYEKIQASG